MSGNFGKNGRIGKNYLTGLIYLWMQFYYMPEHEEPTEYTNVKIPKELSKTIKPVAKKHGYRSVTEFALDAIRRRLEQLKD